jgi:murein DD-endopeptidase MepM/ murein hydrolase activator NlpD
VKKIIPVLIVLFSLVGCSGGLNLLNPQETVVREGGLDHRLWRKHNLWLVAEAYGISVGEIARTNKMKTPFDKETGDTLFIPGAVKYHEVDYKDPGWNVSLKSMSWPLQGDIIRDWNSDLQPEGLEGIDINAIEGEIVRASRDGWVVYAGEDFAPYGKLIIIQHRYVLASLYGCNSELLVKEWTRVEEGEPIAKVGHCPGFNLPSLHFEVAYFNKRINPHKALDISYNEMLEEYDREFDDSITMKEKTE